MLILILYNCNLRTYTTVFKSINREYMEDLPDVAEDLANADITISRKPQHAFLVWNREVLQLHVNKPYRKKKKTLYDYTDLECQQLCTDIWYWKTVATKLLNENRIWLLNIFTVNSNSQKYKLSNNTCPNPVYKERQICLLLDTFISLAHIKITLHVIWFKMNSSHVIMLLYSLTCSYRRWSIRPSTCAARAKTRGTKRSLLRRDALRTCQRSQTCL